MTYILINLILNCQMNCPYTFTDQDVNFFNEYWLHSRGEHLSTTLKVSKVCWYKSLNKSNNNMFWEIGKIVEVQILISQLVLNLLICYPHFFWKHRFSIISLFTLLSNYKNMVLTSACLGIGWNVSEYPCGEYRWLTVVARASHWFSAGKEQISDPFMRGGSDRGRLDWNK